MKSLFLARPLTFLFLLVLTTAQAQRVYVMPVPPEDQFGNVTLNKHSTLETGPVVFEHWLHRSRFTCRVCHIDIGFAMQADATGINAQTNGAGLYCGACHDGKRQVDGITIFQACLPNLVANEESTCSRCHTSPKTKHKYAYKEFTARFPKSNYGVDWMAAEKAELVKPIDIVEGVSIRKSRMNDRADFAFRPRMEHFTGIRYSHELHSKWNGCELCHYEIFPAEKGAQGAGITMHQIAKGKFCGACHLKVAFPVNGCNKCHIRGPAWVDGPSSLM